MPPKKMKREESPSMPTAESSTQTTPVEEPTPWGFIQPFTDATTPKEKEIARYHRALLTMVGQDRSKPHMFWSIPLMLRGGKDYLYGIPDDSMAYLHSFVSDLVKREGEVARVIISQTFWNKAEYELRNMQHEDDIIHLVKVEQFVRQVRERGSSMAVVHEFLRQLSLEILVELSDMSLEVRDELDVLTRTSSGGFTNAALIRDVRPRDARDRLDRVAVRERKEAAYQRAKQNGDRRR